MVDSNTALEKNPEIPLPLPIGAAETLLEIIRTRRSVRRFKKDAIPEEDLQRIFEAARWAPTNCNKQLWRMVVIDELSLKETLVKEAGASTLILHAPVVMVVAHYNDVYIEAYQASSATVQNVLLMANALGLGSLWLNSKGNPEKYHEVLGIPHEYIVTNLILLGYPAKPVSPPPRRDITEFFSKNHFPKGSLQKWVHDPDSWSYERITEYQRFICRKTEIGTCQDVFASVEGELVADISKEFREPHLDFFPYDGHIATHLPKGLEMVAIDSGRETSRYSQATLKAHGNTQFKTWEQFVTSPGNLYASASLLFRAERLPSDFIRELSSQVMTKLAPGGSFFLVFRNRNFFFMLFYRLLIAVLGDNLSKTAIFSFFGPYKPCDTKWIKSVLTETGFVVKTRKRYPLPPIFARIAELITQYRLSKGGNFMHAQKHRNALSRLFDVINMTQARYNLPWFGSISVVVAVKPADDEAHNGSRGGA